MKKHIPPPPSIFRLPLLMLLFLALIHPNGSLSSSSSSSAAAATAASEETVATATAPSAAKAKSSATVSAASSLVASESSSSASSETATPPPPAGVIELDARNFDSSIRDGNVWLVEFYAPWCGHCVRFAPTYEEVAKHLHSLPPATVPTAAVQSENQIRSVRVAKVDGSTDRALSARFSVHGFPSFFLVDGWNVYEYEGRRTLDDLVEFATEEYANQEPIPFLNSPFGPMGQLRAAMMYCGTRIILGYEALVDRGYSKGVSAIIMCTMGITLGMVSIIAVGLMLVPKPKED